MSIRHRRLLSTRRYAERPFARQLPMPRGFDRSCETFGSQSPVPIGDYLVETGEKPERISLHGSHALGSRVTGRGPASNVHFCHMYARARRRWMQWSRKSCDSTDTDDAAIARDRLRIDTRKWLMAKLAPRK